MTVQEMINRLRGDGHARVNVGVPMWCSGLRIWHCLWWPGHIPGPAQWDKDLVLLQLCHRSSFSSDLIPGPVTSVCLGCIQEKKKKKKEWMYISLENPQLTVSQEGLRKIFLRRKDTNERSLTSLSLEVSVFVNGGWWKKMLRTGFPG